MTDKIKTKRKRWLEPQHDPRESFYRKAHVEATQYEGDDYSTKSDLYSYQTKVPRVTTNPETGEEKAIVYLDSYPPISPTSLRHVKEFLKQYGFKADTKKQVERDYGTTGWFENQ